MAGASGLERVREFRFRPLDKPEELRAAEELERQAMGGGTEVPVNVSVLRGALDHGGLVVGAFADIYLAGVGADLLGWNGSELYRFALLTAVRPEYQHHQVAYRLMAYRREAALQQGIPAMRWNFDPLRSRAARLSLRRLGARCEKYLPHHLGRLGWKEEEEMDSDRLRMRWGLNEPEVEARLAGTVPTGAEDLAAYQSARSVVRTEENDQGLRVPTEVGEPAGPLAHLEIPFDLSAVREHDLPSARRWRYAVRDAFRACTDLGYAPVDFLVLPLEHERRAFYLLRPTPPASGGGPAAPSPPK
ncbi:MAG: hypothetical protein L3K04_00910 [Thermoplasmata archaeon]|nr:hypothetical protein [Thermoplasmata archaeon]MCI4337943.1 hypothetical protein [Thermoplasmata archaeon]MCI4340823.1 hypothetical protein [Thermoplasmata archaeon]